MTGAPGPTSSRRPAGRQDGNTPRDPRGEPGFVNCFLAGAQKSGTTALAEFLSHHPDFCLAQGKECHFFDMLAPGDVPRDYAGLAAGFSHWAGEAVRCDATPIYLFLPWIPGMLRAYNPEARIVLILRNPTERAYSHYCMSVARGLERLPFGQALRREAARLAWSDAPARRDAFLREASYVSRGLYADQIENLFRWFPQDRTLILRNEELLWEHEATLRRVHAFLGLAPCAPPPPRQVGRRENTPMPPSERAFLSALFEPEIARLEALLQWDLSHWRSSRDTMSSM